MLKLFTKSEYVLVTMAWIESSKLEIKNSYGIAVSTYPSFGSDALPSSIWMIQSKKCLTSSIKEVEVPLWSRVFCVSFNILQWS